MSKPQPRIATTDEEIDAAIARGESYDNHAPRAIAATYREADDAIAIKLATGVEIAIPRKLMQGLEDKSTADISNVEIVGPGSGLHWESLDVDHYIPSLIQGIFGTRKWMATIGALGGSARSSAKKKSSQVNGRKGGRPKRKSA